MSWRRVKIMRWRGESLPSARSIRSRISRLRADRSGSSSGVPEDKVASASPSKGRVLRLWARRRASMLQLTQMRLIQTPKSGHRSASNVFRAR